MVHLKKKVGQKLVELNILYTHIMTYNNNGKGI